MTKTPPQPALSIVSPEATGGSPPRELGQHGRKLWDEVQAAYGITDRGGVELLAQCCAALDRAEALAEAIARDGPVVYSRSGPKSHPAAKDELACRAFIVRTLSGSVSTSRPLSLVPDGRRAASAGRQVVGHKRHSTRSTWPSPGGPDYPARGRAVCGHGQAAVHLPVTEAADPIAVPWLRALV
jgi:hypothetical protein